MRAHVGQTSVFLKRALAPGFHLKTVIGRSQILQAPPCGSRVMRTKGLSPRHVSHKIGKSVASEEDVAAMARAAGRGAAAR